MMSTTLIDCLDKLKAEKDNKLTSRFPCRVILTHSKESYVSIIEKLKEICDAVVQYEDILDGADIFPVFEKLIVNNTNNSWILLPGISEYLRLFHESEKRSKRFYKLWHCIVDSSNKGRIIIPLWNCDGYWNDPSLCFMTDERQQDFVFNISDDTKDDESLSITIYSSEFEEYINLLNKSETLYVGLKEWFNNIIEPKVSFNDYCLLTKQYKTVFPLNGNIRIKVIKDKCSFVKENLLESDSVDEKQLSDEMIDELLQVSLKHMSLDQSILYCLNAVSFNGNEIMAKWNSLTIGQKGLVKLWYQIHSDSSYLCACFKKASIENIVDAILHDFFNIFQFHDSWEAEYKKLVYEMKLQKDEIFFKELEKIPTIEKRLSFLSDGTKEERVYIIQLVGKWIKFDYSAVKSSISLSKVYPELYAYLQDIPSESESIYNSYISLYKKYKLSNTLPSTDELIGMVDPDLLESRYSVLYKKVKINSFVLWIDGMGFEYLSILLYALNKIENANVSSVDLTQALLPTETEFNSQWEEMDVPFGKKDKLDKLAHRGVVDDPDYYSCVEEQLSFFSDVVKEVKKLLLTYDRVILTGDHGSSRLAARSFHIREGIHLPGFAKICSHGRYCVVNEKDSEINYYGLKKVKDKDKGKIYYVIPDYEHFSISGFAAGGDDNTALYGEVHGGASPEEMIVPVVVIDNKKSIPLSVKWSENCNVIKLKKKKAHFKLEFNKPVKDLKIKVSSFDGICKITNNPNVWDVCIEGIKPGKYELTIVADGSILSIKDNLNIKSPLGEEEIF